MLETAKCQIKNDFKIHVNQRSSQHSDILASLEAKLKQLETENKTLKSQLGDLKKQLKSKAFCQCKQSLQDSRNTQSPSTPLCSSNESSRSHSRPSFTTPQTLTHPLPTSLHPASRASMDVRRDLSILPSTDRSAQTVDTPPPLPSSGPHPSVPLSTAEGTAIQGSKSTTTCTAQHTDHGTVTSTAQHVTHSTVTATAQHAPSSAGTSTGQNAVRSEGTLAAQHAGHSNTFTTQHTTHSASERQIASSSASSRSSTSFSTSLTPRQTLALKRVNPRTTHLVLGDSVTENINPAFVFPSARRTSQNISVCGLTLDDLGHWLRNIPIHRSLQYLSVHIGLNSCRQNIITVGRWTQLYKQLKKTFPSALIAFSSIVPPRTKHHPLTQPVEDSNLALMNMCHQQGVKFINNSLTFTTARGLAKQSLYSGNLLLSGLGTAKLTAAMKYTYMNSIKPPSRDQNNSTVRRPLLPDPDSQPESSSPALLNSHPHSHQVPKSGNPPTSFSVLTNESESVTQTGEQKGKQQTHNHTYPPFPHPSGYPDSPPNHTPFPPPHPVQCRDRPMSGMFPPMTAWPYIWPFPPPGFPPLLPTSFGQYRPLGLY